MSLSFKGLRLDLFMDSRMDLQLKFLKEIDKLKLIKRQGIVSDGSRRENSAEHSWHMAMFIILFEKELPENLDTAKALKLAIVHDLIEIYADDTPIYDKTMSATQEKREMDAAKKLFSQLPEDLAKEFMNLFLEFEEMKTKEAVFVKSFDKLHGVFQNLCENGQAWKNCGVTIDMIENHKRKYMDHDETMTKLFDAMLKEGKDRGLL